MGENPTLPDLLPPKVSRTSPPSHSDSLCSTVVACPRTGRSIHLGHPNSRPALLGASSRDAALIPALHWGMRCSDCKHGYGVPRGAIQKCKKSALLDCVQMVDTKGKLEKQTQFKTQFSEAMQSSRNELERRNSPCLLYGNYLILYPADGPLIPVFRSLDSPHELIARRAERVKTPLLLQNLPPASFRRGSGSSGLLK